MPVQPGYYRSIVIGSDEAGNRTTAFSATVLEDINAPTVSALDLPGAITGNTTVNFPASASETSANGVGDIVNSYAALNYAGSTGAMTLRYPNTAVSGAVAFDNVLTRTATISPAVTNFIKNLKQGSPGTAVGAAAAGDNVVSITEAAVEASSLQGTLTGNFAPVVSITAASGTSSWSTTTFLGGVSLGASAGTIWNCPTATTCGAGSNTGPGGPTSTVLSITANGNSGTFNNPFVAVTFWYQNGAGQWIQFGSTTAGTASDAGSGIGLPQNMGSPAGFLF